MLYYNIKLYNNKIILSSKGMVFRTAELDGLTNYYIVELYVVLQHKALQYFNLRFSSPEIVSDLVFVLL